MVCFPIEHWLKIRLKAAFMNILFYRRRHEKTSYVSNYASLLYCMNESIEGGHINWKNSSVCNSDFIARSAIIGVFLIDVSALYQPIQAVK